MGPYRRAWEDLRVLRRALVPLAAVAALLLAAIWAHGLPPEPYVDWAGHNWADRCANARTLLGPDAVIAIDGRQCP